MKFKELSVKEQKVIVIIIGISIFFFLFVTIFDQISIIKTIERGNYGDGDRKEQFEVSVGNKVKNEPITVVVKERVYTKEQQKKVFRDCCKELDQLILGKNKSLDEVRNNLNLVTTMPNDPVDIIWEINNYDVMNVKGELITSKLVETGTLVELKATLSYKDAKMQYVTNANLFPPLKSHNEKIIEKIQKEMEVQNQKTKWSPYMILPSSMGKESLKWSRGTQGRSFGILLIGGILVILVFVKHRQSEKEYKEKKEKQMMLSYPEIVNHFVLLVGAGMTVKNAWKTIVTDYQKRGEKGNFAYEEMLYTLREMQSGVTEAESYERFGSRCGIPAYLKFGALLSQNLRKGTKGLTELLTMEAVQAFEERKAMAKRMGEEASTKLLMPMFLMLAVVLVIVIVPAFLSMQM